MNHRKFTAILSAAVLCTVIPLTGCAKAEKEFQILYEDVAEICLYKRPDIAQVVQIPLIVNQQVDEFIISEIGGEHIDPDHIGINFGFISENDSRYTYLISLSFQWNDYVESDADVIIESLDLMIGDKTYEYNFGKAVILNEICQNNCDAVLFGSLGTGFSQLDFFKFDLDFQDDVTLLSIDNTIDLPLKNAFEYLKEYDKGTHTEFMLDTDASNFNKLYYAFDFSVRYQYNNEEQKFYFVPMPVQSSIEGRLPDFLEANPLS